MSVAKEVADELRKHGAKDIHFVHGSKHGRVYYAWNGREQFYVVPMSESDHRAAKRARSDIRRILGVTNARPKSPNRGKRKDVCKREKWVLPKMTMKPDPFEALGPVKTCLDDCPTIGMELWAAVRRINHRAEQAAARVKEATNV